MHRDEGFPKGRAKVLPVLELKAGLWIGCTIVFVPPPFFPFIVPPIHRAHLYSPFSSLLTNAITAPQTNEFNVANAAHDHLHAGARCVPD
jgi:hypothetical protein